MHAIDAHVVAKKSPYRAVDELEAGHGGTMVAVENSDDGNGIGVCAPRFGIRLSAPAETRVNPQDKERKTGHYEVRSLRRRGGRDDGIQAVTG
jgi:hypothetical protein